jgi:hypothetical protein
MHTVTYNKVVPAPGPVNPQPPQCSCGSALLPLLCCGPEVSLPSRFTRIGLMHKFIELLFVSHVAAIGGC